MKISEMKTTEGWLSDLDLVLGNKPSKSKEHEEIKSIFVDDFVEDLTSSLGTAVSKKMINVNKTSSPTPPVTKTESKNKKTYASLNRIFENIVSINEEEKGETVSSFIKRWFNLYMRGVDWKSSSSQVNDVDNAIMDIEKAFNSGKNITQITPLLVDLAEIAYVISKTSPNIPAGMKDQLKQAQSSQSRQPAAQSAAKETTMTYDNIKDAVLKLDPTYQKDLINVLLSLTRASPK